MSLLIDLWYSDPAIDLYVRMSLHPQLIVGIVLLGAYLPFKR